MSKSKEIKRKRRKKHIRKNLSGTTERPRVYVYRSNKYLYTGVADDVKGIVLLTDKSIKDINSAKKLGEKMGKDLKKKKIDTVVFDRSGYKYHGRVKALADGLRESGIVF